MASTIRLKKVEKTREEVQACKQKISYCLFHFQMLTYVGVVLWFIALNLIRLCHMGKVCGGDFTPDDKPDIGILSTEGEVMYLFIMSGWFIIALMIFLYIIIKKCE